MVMSEKATPRWDMTTLFPSLASPEFEQEFESAMREIADIGVLFESYGIHRRETASVEAAFVSAYEEIAERLNKLEDRLRTLRAYIGCFTSTDARDEVAKSYESLFTTRSVPLDKLNTRLIAWIGTSDVEALLAQSEVARKYEYHVRRASYLAQRQMSAVEEDLASELRSSALTGWAKLHGNLTALLTADVSVQGVLQTLPMSSVRASATNPDRVTRQSAFEAELKVWESVSLPLASALNGIKGYQQTVRKRRGYTDDVEPTLFANGIDRPTLDAMQQACVESFPDFQRYMDAKARVLGLEHLAWYDLNAPVGTAPRVWSWSEAETFICTHFGQYSGPLADFAARSFSERWIDAEPRIGKRSGAYCTGVRADESRVMMNYDGSFNSVSTLAHELGHAYHNLTLAGRAPMQRGLPSTLAETASIFCETLAFDAALSGSDTTASERLVLLDTVLERNLMVVVDIHSRFLFEQSVFAQREARDLSVTEFCALMTEAQLQTYGEKVAPLHPYMWAVKGHYYGPTFYNYPYPFGLLFGLGLYAYFKSHPATFRAQYDDFLSSTGMYDAKTLAARFGIDITTADFWRFSLDVIRGQIAEFERLAK